MGVTTYTNMNGVIMKENRAGVIRDYVPDPLGSTVAPLDNTQSQTDTFTYWPYGEDNQVTGTGPTPFRYVGTLGYHKDSTSRTYVRARYLNRQVVRWMTLDPVGFDGGDWNLYRYVHNRPVFAVDPSGMQGDPQCWVQVYDSRCHSVSLAEACLTATQICGDIGVDCNHPPPCPGGILARPWTCTCKVHCYPAKPGVTCKDWSYGTATAKQYPVACKEACSIAVADCGDDCQARHGHCRKQDCHQ